MSLNEVLNKKGITKYRLSKISGVPNSTIKDLANGRSDFELCSLKTIRSLASALDMDLEEFIIACDNVRVSPDNYRSYLQHRLKSMGDKEFYNHYKETEDVLRFYLNKQYFECLYLLSLLDYLARINEFELIYDYDFLRNKKLNFIHYPADVILLSELNNTDEYKEDARKKSIPEFIKHNIVEVNIRDVA